MDYTSSDLEKDVNICSVRPDLQENAFRKYELLIARACVSSFVLDPRTLGPDQGFRRPITATSFRARFLDACLAQRRFGYTSDVIPKDVDLADITCKILTDGKVLLENKRLTRLEKVQANRLHASNKDLILKLATEINTKRVAGTYADPVYVGYDTPEELAWLLSLEDQFTELIAKEKPGKMVMLF